MNRSIFIVIVDFLLLSLIAFARFDTPEQTPPTRPVTASANLPERRQDMVEVMKESLDQERQERDKLAQQLNLTQEALRTREQMLAERERRIQLAQNDLQQKSEEAQRLAQERAALASQFENTRSSLATLQNQLTASSNEARLSKERLAAMETDLRKRQDEMAQAKSEAQLSKERLAAMEADLRKRQEVFETANSEARVTKGVLDALQEDLRKQSEQSQRLQQTLASLEQERSNAEAEKQILANRLQVVETEKQLAREQAESMKGEVHAERQEKARLLDQTAKLTEGVTALASKSDSLRTELGGSVSNLTEKSEALREEIQQNRPWSANTLYGEYLTNRVMTSVYASRSGILGQVERTKESNSVLVSDGTNVCALMHVEDTPLSFDIPGVEWERLMINVRHKTLMVSASQLNFWAYDPRVVLVPVDPVRVKALNVKVYNITADPHKFEEAILVSAREQGYGECRFTLNPENPQYVRMDRNLLKRLVGTFSPSSGDLVFSKNGHVLGVMVNKEYCALIHKFESLYSFRTGLGVPNQQTGNTLAQLRLHITGLPLKLQ